MTTIAKSNADPWAGILQEGEEILWQGAPDPGFRLKAGGLYRAAFGLVFTGFSIFWMVIAALGGGFFWMFGLLFFFVGLSVVFNAVLSNTLLRRNSFYTLTNQRAFIATKLPFRSRKLNSYPINADMPLSLHVGTFDRINFAARLEQSDEGSDPVPIGFQDIAEGQKVFQMMSRIQKGDAP